MAKMEPGDFDVETMTAGELRERMADPEACQRCGNWLEECETCGELSVCPCGACGYCYCPVSGCDWCGGA